MSGLFQRLSAAFSVCLFCASMGQGHAAVLMHETFTPPGGCPASGYSTWFPDGWTRFNLDGHQQDAAFAEGWAVGAAMNGGCAAAAESFVWLGSPSDHFCTPAMTLPAKSWLQWTTPGASSAHRVRMMRVPPAFDGSNLAGDGAIVWETHFGGFGETRYLALHDLGYSSETVHACFEYWRRNQTEMYVDDVILRDEPLAHDLALVELILPPYSTIPLGQAEPFDLVARVANNGSATASRVVVAGVLDFPPDLELPTSSVQLDELPAGNQADLHVATLPFEQPGTWLATFAVAADDEDDAPFNNTAYEQIARITDLSLSRSDNDDKSLHLGVIGGYAGAELGHQFDLAKPATIVAAQFYLHDVKGGFWPVPPLENIPITARLRRWDPVAGQPGELIAEGTGTTSNPIQSQSTLGVRFPPLALDSGRYVVTLVDPDVPAEPIPLLLSPTRRERDTSWMDWPGNPSGRWVHFDEVDPAINGDLHMALTVVSAGDHYPYPDQFTVLEDSLLSASVADNDLLAAGAEHVWKPRPFPANQVEWMQLSGSGELLLMPRPNFHGPISLQYQLCVGDLCRSASIAVDVLSVDEGAPVARDDFFVVPSDRFSVLDLLANDVMSPDGGNYAQAMTQPAFGTVSVSGTSASFYPSVDNPGGQDGFTYRLCDSDGDCSEASVVLEVVPVIFRDSFE